MQLVSKDAFVAKKGSVRHRDVISNPVDQHALDIDEAITELDAAGFKTDTRRRLRHACCAADGSEGEQADDTSHPQSMKYFLHEVLLSTASVP